MMDIESRLLYRDALVLIIDKPAGIPVHKGSGGGENLEQHFEALRFGLPRPPSLAHRLDRDTSGCLVLGRHRQALARLGKLFEQNKVQKTYWALVQGTPAAPTGDITLPLGRASQQSHRWHMKVDEENGQPSHTSYRVLGSNATHSWLELTPHTGRTHQLRVHCAAIGHAIVGDKYYGTAAPEGLQLHARAIGLPLYPNKPAIHAAAPVPAHMLPQLAACGYTPAPEAAP